MRSAIILWFAIVVSQGHLRAGMIHAEVAVWGEGGGVSLVSAERLGYLDSASGSNAASVDQYAEAETNHSGFQVLESHSLIGGGSSFDHWIKISAFGSSEAGSGFYPGAQASAVARWTDQVQLTGTSPLPSAVRLTFGMTGFLSGTAFGGPPVTGWASRLEAWVFNELGGDYTVEEYASGSLSGSGTHVTNQIELGYSAGGLDSLSIDGNAFSGTFSADVNLDNISNLYDFQVTFKASTDAHFASATANLANSMSLLSVTDTNGNALDDFQVSFTSGRQVSATAVPEPSSAVLFIGGFAVCLMRRWRR